MSLEPAVAVAVETGTEVKTDEVIGVDRWKETLPEDIRETSYVKEAPDLTTAIKSGINFQKMMGSRFKVPEDGDTKGWDEVYNKLGRPESVDKYNIKRPDTVEGIEYSDDREKSFKEISHKLGLNNSQVQALVDWNQGQSLGQLGKFNEAAKDAISQLKLDWGTAFDERIEVTERIMGEFGDDGAEAAVKDNPALIKMVYEMGKNLLEGKAGGDGKTTYGMAPKEALNEINKKMRDPQFMEVYTKANAYGHAEAVEEIKKLNEMAYPEPV